MLQQLQAAGHIPPSPFPGSTQAPPPPPALVVAVQQMLQLQQLLQRLQIQQAAAHQTKLPRPPAGTDPLTITIAKIRQQINALQVQIQAYRQQLIQPPNVGSLFDVSSHDIAREFTTALQVRGDTGNVSQWKSPSVPDTSVLLPHSRGNDLMQPPSAAGLLSNPVPVNGWPGWPGLSSSGVGRSMGGGIATSDNNEGASRGGMLLEGSVPQSSDSVGGANGGLASAAAGLDIEEFVPGKPWQGPAIRTAEDDPFVTPGSVPRSAFNLGAVDDAHVMNVLGNKMSPNPVSSASSSWLPSETRNMSGGWTRGINPDQELFAQGSSKGLQRTPPGLAMPAVPWHQPVQHPSFSRSTSWAPKSSFGKSYILDFIGLEGSEFHWICWMCV
jgi:trinucleotide repeat-containing gene 6 protein